jgi:outer membrane murein-binding lipoprotein Lpp
VILIRTRWKVVSRALLASAVGGTGLLAGCTDSNKSDGQIAASPEASNAAQAIAKSYGENMKKKYANQIKKRP